MPTFESLAPVYRDRYQTLAAKPGYDRMAEKVAGRLYFSVGRYIAIGSALSIPPVFVMVTHERESSGDFGTYLGNGDSLNRPTTDVPEGRGPFASFEDGCADSVKLEGLDKITNWSVERLLYEEESFNGWGYYYKGLPSPYVWAGTTIQKPGKYVADNVFDSDVVDPQLGCALIYARLIQMDPALALPA